METIEENKEGSVIENITDNQSTKSEGSSVTTRKAERRSERQRAKRQIFANGQSESKEDTSDRKVEQKHKSITPRRILTSDYSSEEGEREDPPSRPGSAYEIYKQAGEWWKYVLNFTMSCIFLNYTRCFMMVSSFVCIEKTESQSPRSFYLQYLTKEILIMPQPIISCIKSTLLEEVLMSGLTSRE